MTPVQIKTKLFRVIANPWAWQVSLTNCTLVIFLIGLARRRSTSKISVTRTCCTVQRNKYDVQKLHRYSYCEFVASEHRKNILPSSGLPSKNARQSNSSKANLYLVAIVSQARLSDKYEKRQRISEI